MRTQAVIGMLLAACGTTSTAPPSRPPSLAAIDRPPRLDFRSGFWTNLHHALHYEATARRPPPAAAPAPPSDPEWTAAVAYYRARFGERGGFGLFLDPELIAIHRLLSALDAEEPPSALDPELAARLDGAAELARQRWPAQDRANAAWIAALTPLLDAHGAAMRDGLVAIYGVPWPDEPIRVDVACFAGPVGAYTVEDPVHILISSCDPAYAGDAALEMIFHEASHALVGELERRIDAEAARLGREPPENLWHAVIFYTAGELARRRLGPRYVPYAEANGLWGRAMGEREPLRREWQPYLDGERDLDAAVHALVASAP